jgi:hypothetical protein
VLWVLVCCAVKIGIVIANNVRAIAIAVMDIPSMIIVVVFDANMNFCYL